MSTVAAMCDTLCVLGEDRVLFAKSSDRPVGEVQLFRSYGRRPGGGTLRTQYLSILDHGSAAFVGGAPTWLWGVEHGVNEHRVAIGNERVWTVDDADASVPALLGMDLVRLGLERGRTAADALDLMINLVEEHGQGGIGEEATGEAYFSSFLLADPTEAWILETSNRTWAAKSVGRRGARGGSISNRLTLETEWTRASRNVPPGANFQRWRDQEYPTAHADRRLAATSAVACAEPAPGPGELAAVLRHHGGRAWGTPTSSLLTRGEIDPLPPPKPRRDGTGVSVCMHLRGWEATTAAMIASLPQDPHEPLRAWVLLGNPCVGVFVPTFPPGPVPTRLDDPATWHRFDVLKRRVERAADLVAERGAPATGGTHPEDTTDDDDLAELERIRAVLGPLEAQLWHEADEVARHPSGQASFAASVNDRLDEALTRLERHHRG